MPSGDFEFQSFLHFNWNSSARKNCFSSTIYLFIQYFIWACGYLFYARVIIQLNHHLFSCPDYPRFGHWELLQVGSCVLSTNAPLFQAIPYFLVPQDVSGSACISLPQSWNQPILQGSLVPYIGEWCLNTKIWAPGELTVTEVSLSLSNESQKICIYANPSICILCINFRVYIPVYQDSHWFLRYNPIPPGSLQLSPFLICNIFLQQ